MKLYIILIGVLVLGLIAGGIYMEQKQIINLLPERQEGLAGADTTRTIGAGKNKVTLSYFSANETIIVKDSNGNTLLNMRLTSPKVNVISVGGINTQVAEFYLEDYANLTTGLVDTISFKDLNNNNATITKQIVWRYGVDYNSTECRNDDDLSSCYNTTEINWTEFSKMTEIPNKQIRIGMFTYTELGENIEWIIGYKGFTINEWAEWDILTAVYTNNLSIIGQDTTMLGIFLNSSGTGMYLVGTTGDKVYQYSLSTPWLVTSAVNTNNLSMPDTNVKGIFLNSSGTGMYLVGASTDKVFQYYLSTPWLVTSAVNTNNLSVIGQDSNVEGIFINSSGTGMYILGSTGDKVYQYSLSTPWLVTSAVNTNNLSILGQDTGMNDIFLNSSGIGMYLVGSTDKVFQYYLSTPWLVTSAVNTNNLSVIGQDGTMTGIFLNSSGTGMYLVGTDGDKVYQYFMAPTSDTTAPAWSSNSTNGTTAGTWINHSVVWTDTALSNFTFSFDNGTGTFVNDSSVVFTGTSNQSSVLKFVNQTTGSTIRWIVYAWDSTGNSNGTSIFSYLTTSAPSNCWTNDTVNKLLIIPNGCVFQGDIGW